MGHRKHFFLFLEQKFFDALPQVNPVKINFPYRNFFLLGKIWKNIRIDEKKMRKWKKSLAVDPVKGCCDLQAFFNLYGFISQSKKWCPGGKSSNHAISPLLSLKLLF